MPTYGEVQLKAMRPIEAAATAGALLGTAAFAFAFIVTEIDCRRHPEENCFLNIFVWPIWSAFVAAQAFASALLVVFLLYRPKFRLLGYTLAVLVAAGIVVEHVVFALNP